MSRVIKCDRCGGEISDGKIGYISMMERKDGDQLVGDNPFESMDFCRDCMELIKGFITNAEPVRMAKPKSKRGGGAQARSLRRTAEERGGTTEAGRQRQDHSAGQRGMEGEGNRNRREVQRSDSIQCAEGGKENQ